MGNIIERKCNKEVEALSEYFSIDHIKVGIACEQPKLLHDIYHVTTSHKVFS